VSIEDAYLPETSEAGHDTPSPKAAAPAPEPAAEVAAAAPAPTAPPAREAHPAAPARTRRAVAAPQAVARVESDWRSQASHAHYPAALASAIREGWRKDCEQLGVEDVLLLGDVARLSGDLPRAEEAYQAARHRFPAADRPLYSLGLVAYEGRHDYAGAARLFDAYLRYFPSGALVREAAGRLLEARLKAGETGPAREAAADYLHRYPDGPHAALARRTVGP
jgi:TolA-binding protein